MSVHLVDCASKQQLPSHLKLALLCFADSGSNENHVAFPGIDGVMTWCGVRKSQAYDLIRDLCALGLLQKVSAGYKGRRAEYLVFPAGCCELHRRELAEVHPIRVPGDVTAAGQDSGVPESTAAPVAAADAAPIPAAPDSSPAKIPAGPPLDSGGTPSAFRPPRSNPDASLRPPPQQPTPGSHLPAQPHDARGPTIDFTHVIPPEARHENEPPARAPRRPRGRLDRRPCDLPNCDNGRLLGLDGTPRADCPNCVPLAGTIEGATG